MSAGAQPPDWHRYSVLTEAGPEETPPVIFQKVNRLVYNEHKIQRGEYSAWHLAKVYRTTAMSLQTTNNDEMLVLYPGKKVLVHNKDGQLYQVRKASETLDAVVGRWYKDSRQAVRFKEQIVMVNKLPGSAMLEDYEFLKGARLLLPKVKMIFDTYSFPFQDGRPAVSSGYGLRRHPMQKTKKFHEGLDYPKPWGTPVFPSRSGKVVEADWTEGYGMLLVIRHSDGATTRYGHLSRIFVRVGQMVQRGRTLIGRVGSTGLSTGPHLHFEVRDKNGKAHNPRTKIGRR